MAVFTEVTAEQAQALLGELKLGELRELRGIEGGIENTNYFATTSEGEYVLTLFERLTLRAAAVLPALMKHLAQRGIPVPDPAANRDGDILHTVSGKPAAVVNRLRGKASWPPARATAPPWAPCWRACTWPGATSTAASPTCAACPGGTRPCRWCCPLDAGRRPRCCAPSWPTRTTWRPARLCRAAARAGACRPVP
jgi:hypothetical protein